MKLQRVEQMGEAVQGVRLHGSPQRPEPIHFRVVFPGGDVDVVRTTDNDYWVHVRVNTPENCILPDSKLARITDARLDIDGMSVNAADVGHFDHPALYHMAVRITEVVKCG